MSIDKFLSKTYDKNNYNCAHFTVDVYKHLTGVDIESNLKGLLFPLYDNHATLELRKGFTRLQSPESPCIVLFSGKGIEPHVGVYYNGRVIHLGDSGAQYVDIDIIKISFKTVRYYKC
jgi:hypothetical protein